MDFSPAQIATMQRFPVGSIITLATIGGQPTEHKAKISRWTVATYNVTADKQETGLCFSHGGEDVPPTPAIQIAENTPRAYNILHGFDSEENHVATDDYPYGSKRCTCRWWVETPTKGAGKGQQRFMQQTINPTTGRTNKPKGSVYCDFQIMYVDNIGHVHNYALNVFHGPTYLAKFIATGLFAQLDENEKKRFGLIMRAARKFQPNEWARFDCLMNNARERLNGGLPQFTEADAKAVAQKTQNDRPDDRHVYEQDATEALNAACAEMTTGVKFDL